MHLISTHEHPWFFTRFIPYPSQDSACPILTIVGPLYALFCFFSFLARLVVRHRHRISRHYPARHGGQLRTYHYRHSAALCFLRLVWFFDFAGFLGWFSIPQFCSLTGHGQGP